MRGPLLPLLLVLGCSAAQVRSTAPPPAAARDHAATSTLGGDPRAEIASLEERIRTLRDALDRPPATEPGAGPPAADDDAREIPSPVAEPAPRAEAVAPAGRPGGPRRSPRCQQIDRISDEICHAAGRICALSGELDEDQARASCARARSDCERAKLEAEGCR